MKYLKIKINVRWSRIIILNIIPKFISYLREEVLRDAVSEAPVQFVLGIIPKFISYLREEVLRDAVSEAPVQFVSPYFSRALASRRLHEGSWGMKTLALPYLSYARSYRISITSLPLLHRNTTNIILFQRYIEQVFENWERDYYGRCYSMNFNWHP